MDVQFFDDSAFGTAVDRSKRTLEEKASFYWGWSQKDAATVREC